MKYLLASLFVLVALALPVSASAQSVEAETRQTPQAMTPYLFIGHVSPQGWLYMIENASDRETAAREAVENMGGELVAYYFGFGNSKNYVIVNLPDKRIAKATQILRLSSGFLVDYEIVELISPREMSEISQAVQDLRRLDDIQNQD